MLPIFILAGGFGSRLWPLSTRTKPKQFLSIMNIKASLLQITIDRINQLKIPKKIYILCNNEYVYQVRNEILKCNKNVINKITIISEPSYKDTLTSLMIAFYCAKNILKSSQMLIIPSDHLIDNEDHLFEQILAAYNANKIKKSIILFGIKCKNYTNQYGYILASISTGHEDLQKVIKFIEKPDYTAIKDMLFSDNYDPYWNSGMFLADISKMQNIIEKDFADHLSIVANAFNKAINQPALIELGQYDNIDNLTKVSIDYSILQNTQDMYVIPTNLIWTDLGSFSTISSNADSYYDDNNQIDIDAERHFLYNVKNCFIKTESNNHMIIASDISDLNIIINDNVVLIGNKKSNYQRIQNNLSKNITFQPANKLCYFYWGFCRILYDAYHITILLITVKPKMNIIITDSPAQKYWHITEGSCEMLYNRTFKNLKAGSIVEIAKSSDYSVINHSKNKDFVVLEIQYNSQSSSLNNSNLAQ